MYPLVLVSKIQVLFLIVITVVVKGLHTLRQSLWVSSDFNIASRLLGWNPYSQQFCLPGEIDDSPLFGSLVKTRTYGPFVALI